MDKKKGLGRGLESLFGFYDDNSNEIITNQSQKESKNNNTDITELQLVKIYPNPNQPRKHFDDQALQELASSIKVHGIIQPLVVNKTDENNFMIIAGERRWRAAKLAGLKKFQS